MPAVLLGFLDSPARALYVGLLYLGVQLVETYVLAPFIDRKTIYLPPALTVLAQLTMAVFAAYWATGRARRRTPDTHPFVQSVDILRSPRVACGAFLGAG